MMSIILKSILLSGSKGGGAGKNEPVPLLEKEGLGEI